jgi:hypothetical protein
VQIEDSQQAHHTSSPLLLRGCAVPDLAALCEIRRQAACVRTTTVESGMASGARLSPMERCRRPERPRVEGDGHALEQVL